MFLSFLFDLNDKRGLLNRRLSFSFVFFRSTLYFLRTFISEGNTESRIELLVIHYLAAWLPAAQDADTGGGGQPLVEIRNMESKIVGG